MLYTKDEDNVTTFTKQKLLVKIFPSRVDMGEKAARDVASKIKTLLTEKEEVNMIFAAAPSQDEFIKSLIADRTIPWQQINAFHMDEYIGLKSDAAQCFSNYLKERLFDRVSFKNVYCIEGDAADQDKECMRYANLLLQHPLDIVCMGIGENGHLAFNDPPVADFHDPQIVKVVELEQTCRQQQVNDNCFSSLDLVPKRAITVTIPTLINAHFLFCVVPAISKAQAIFHTLNNDIDERCPATILRRKNNAILYLDKESASRIHP